MDGDSARKMRANLVRGVLILLGCLAGMLLVQLVLDQMAASAVPEGVLAGEEYAVAPGTAAYLAFALDGDGAGVGVSEGVPEAFSEECFDPALLGESRSACAGTVVQVVAPGGEDALLEACRQRLVESGWRMLDSSGATCATFAKDGGRYRWLFLSVGPVAGSASAVMVLQEAA